LSRKFEKSSHKKKTLEKIPRRKGEGGRIRFQQNVKMNINLEMQNKKKRKNETGKVSRRFSVVEVCHKSKHKLETNTFDSLFASKGEKGLNF
jgi:hypothetical protein